MISFIISVVEIAKPERQYNLQHCIQWEGLYEGHVATTCQKIWNAWSRYCGGIVLSNSWPTAKWTMQLNISSMCFWLDIRRIFHCYRRQIHLYMRELISESSPLRLVTPFDCPSLPQIGYCSANFLLFCAIAEVLPKYIYMIYLHIIYIISIYIDIIFELNIDTHGPFFCKESKYW